MLHTIDLPSQSAKSRLGTLLHHSGKSCDAHSHNLSAAAFSNVALLIAAFAAWLWSLGQRPDRHCIMHPCLGGASVGSWTDTLLLAILGRVCNYPQQHRKEDNMEVEALAGPSCQRPYRPGTTGTWVITFWNLLPGLWGEGYDL